MHARKLTVGRLILSSIALTGVLVWGFFALAHFAALVG